MSRGPGLNRAYSEEERALFAQHREQRAAVRPAACHMAGVGGSSPIHLGCWVEEGPPGMRYSKAGSVHLVCRLCGEVVPGPAPNTGRPAGKWK